MRVLLAGEGLRDFEVKWCFDNVIRTFTPKRESVPRELTEKSSSAAVSTSIFPATDDVWLFGIQACSTWHDPAHDVQPSLLEAVGRVRMAAIIKVCTFHCNCARVAARAIKGFNQHLELERVVVGPVTATAEAILTEWSLLGERLQRDLGLSWKLEATLTV